MTSRRDEHRAAMDAIRAAASAAYPHALLSSTHGLDEGRLVVYVDGAATDEGRVALLAVRAAAERAGWEVRATLTGLRCKAATP